MLISKLCAAALLAATATSVLAQEEPVIVNIDNFTRAESDLYFDRLAKQSGGVNRWYHYREVTPIDAQTVVRMNRDTLYSQNIVDISEGATLTVPDMGDRYFSVMTVTQDHYIDVITEPGTHELTMDEFETPYLLLAPRIFVDPNDPDDLAAAHALQDQLELEASSAKPFTHPEYDQASQTANREALEQLGKFLTGRERQFGTKDEVEPTRYLIGAATGWGGLPTREAYYISHAPGLPADGVYRMTFGDVPVGGFWSISLYNSTGYFEKNDLDSYTVNSVTATPNEDGSVTVQFGGCDADTPNCLPIMDGWEYQWRFYRPQQALFDGSWPEPELESVE